MDPNRPTSRRIVGKCRTCANCRAPFNEAERLSGMIHCRGIDAHRLDHSCNKYEARRERI